jgi:HK97 family phage major capsid protein
MKKKLMEMLAKKEARKKELETNSEASKDVVELRSINAELKTLNGEIAELRSMIAELPDDVPEGTPAPAAPESRGAAQVPQGGFTPLASYGGLGQQGQEEQRNIEKMSREEILGTPEYRSAFLKTLLGKPMNDTEKRTITAVEVNVEKRAYDSSTTAVIPTTTSDMLFQKMVKIAPLINEITLLRVAGNVKFAVEGTRDSAALHTDNTAITPAGDTLVYVELGGYDITKVIRISKTIQTMAITAFEGWLTDMIAADVAVKIEDFTINGTGSSQPNGVEKAITWEASKNAVEFTKGGSPTYDNVVDMVSYLPARYSGNAKFLCNNKFLYGQLAKIKDEQKRPILVQDFSNPVAQRILGFPVLISDKVASNTMYFGDFKQMVGNLAQDVTVETSTASGFLNRSIDFLGSALYDCDVALTDAFCKMTEATV